LSGAWRELDVFVFVASIFIIFAIFSKSFIGVELVDDAVSEIAESALDGGRKAGVFDALEPIASPPPPPPTLPVLDGGRKAGVFDALEPVASPSPPAEVLFELEPVEPVLDGGRKALMIVA
jgi:hypothetical protein